ncbi:membrane dipeptidase GliJ-like protein [Peziza echinospora]|nr:membrane dipeptidase GliJ-like protein [Peziza echinospora]
MDPDRHLHHAERGELEADVKVEVNAVGTESTSSSEKSVLSSDSEKLRTGATTTTTITTPLKRRPKREWNRRKALLVVCHLVLIGFALTGFLMYARGWGGGLAYRCGYSDSWYEYGMDQQPVLGEEEIRMVKENVFLKTVGVIDGHNDLPYHIRHSFKNTINNENFTFSVPPYLPTFHTDLPRLKQGQVAAQFWSAYVGCPASNFDSKGKEFGDEIYRGIVHDTLQQIDLIKRFITQQQQQFDGGSDGEAEDESYFLGLQGGVGAVASGMGLTWDDAKQAYVRRDAAEWGFYGGGEGLRDRKISSMIGVEGLHQIGNSAATLRLYYELGVRYITLTHGCDNAYADGAVFGREEGKGGRWGGLSERGRGVVAEMNRIGMIVDLSHVTREVMRDVLTGGTVKAPVIFSHSSAYALCPHTRNVPDDILHLVKENGGVVMVNFYPVFISCGEGRKPQDATLEMVADHIEHIAHLIGWDHVGIGSDFDGIEITPKGLEDVSKYPDLFKELLRRGAAVEDLEKLANRNVLRVWRKVEEVRDSEEMRRRLPWEDEGEVEVEPFVLAGPGEL